MIDFLDHTPDGWIRVPLEKISDVIMGQSPASQFVNDDQVGVPFLQGNADFTSKHPIPIHWVTRPTKQAKKDDILISVRAPVGEINIADDEYCIGRGLAAIRFYKNIDRLFGWYAIGYYKDQLNQWAQGSTFTAVSSTDVKQLRITLPQNEYEQRKIAEILTTVDDAIEQTEALIHNYQRIKQGLMQDLFTKGINPRRSLTSTELGTIPDEWKISQIKKITNVRRGASPRPIDDPRYFNDTGRGWVRISDVTSTYKYLRTTSQYLSNLGSSLSVKVNPGDLIMSICASIGKPIILDMPACIHDGFVLFQDIHPDFDPEFLFYFLDYRSEFIRGMNQTGTQGNLNTGIVKSIFVPQPRLEEQKEIISVLSSIDKSIENETQERNKLVRIKQGLMQDLLTGKVRVNTLLKN